jgi:hypothetical protein
MVVSKSRTLSVLLFKNRNYPQVRSLFDHKYHSSSLLIALSVHARQAKWHSVGWSAQVSMLLALAVVVVICAKPSSVNCPFSQFHHGRLCFMLAPWLSAQIRLSSILIKVYGTHSHYRSFLWQPEDAGHVTWVIECKCQTKEIDSFDHQKSDSHHKTWWYYRLTHMRISSTQEDAIIGILTNW